MGSLKQMAKEMMEVEKASYIKLVRKVRDLEQENDKLTAYMKVISEAVHESQTRNRVYNKRAEVPTNKCPSRSNGDGVRKRDTGQILRTESTVPVGGVQIPLHNSAPYKPRFTKGASKTKPATTKVAEESVQKRRPGLRSSRL